MLIEVKVPQLSESVSEATLVTWHKKEGDAVSRDENLIDIETDKVVLETPAPADGVLVKIIKQGGDTVTSGELIAQIDTEAKAAAGAAAPAAAAAAPAAAPAAAAGAAGAASPAARKILDEKGIASADVAGSGRGGRVTKEDAVAAQPKAAAAAAPAVIAAVGDRPEERVPMTRLRARIAERLLQSKNENAILTTFNEVNMAPVMALRKQYGDKFEKAHGVRLGFMGFFVKAAVAALKKFPILNASVDGNDIVYHGYIDIGIAVG
ncbi:2-oxo acid dehydrogenase subunit E2, partial [Thauera sp.]|uniref:2-oxo acid dehydrogenase subunit E2 n=1 Tax=Thauera sp. TaxID=1905334 RepID=UPI0026163CBB